MIWEGLLIAASSGLGGTTLGSYMTVKLSAKAADVAETARNLAAERDQWEKSMDTRMRAIESGLAELRGVVLGLTERKR
jgi:hypothetical protein